MLRRTGRVAVATVAAVVGVADDIDDVADNADDVLGFALFFLEGWFNLFVSTCLFCPWAVEAETMDTSGAVGCAFGNVCELAAHSRQGSRVRPFVFMTNLPAKRKPSQE